MLQQAGSGAVNAALSRAAESLERMKAFAAANAKVPCSKQACRTQTLGL